MFDFLNSEVNLMDVAMATVLTGCIAGAVALISSFIIYFNKLGKVIDETKILAKEHGGLSGEHKGLSVEHKDISNAQHSISTSVALMSQTTVDTKIIVSQMKKSVDEEKIAQQFRYDNLTEKQKSITENVTDTIKAFEALKDEFLRVNEKNSTLQSQMQKISEESNELKTLNAKLERKNHELKQEFDKLLAHDNKMVIKSNKYAEELNRQHRYADRGQEDELEDEWEMDM